MKNVYLLAFFLFTTPLFSQILIDDSFDQYNLNFVGLQADYITTWSDNPGGIEDAMVVNSFAASGSQSIEIKGDLNFINGGPMDLILKLGDKTTGSYKVSFDMLINDADGAYYNFQHFEEPGLEWAFEVNIEGGGVINGLTSATIVAGGGFPTNFHVQRGQWVNFTHLVDLDNEEITLLLDDVHIDTWAFDMQNNSPIGTNQLGAINFFPRDWVDHFYIDNVFYEDITVVNTTTIIPSKMQLYPNPTNDRVWLKLENNTSIADVLVLDQQGNRVMELPSTKNNQLISLAHLPKGMYFFSIKNKNVVFQRKLLKL